MMFKFISVFALKPGYDPDDTYKLWLSEHAPNVKAIQLPELKKYVIGRVVNNPNPGENFFGVAQLSYATLEDVLRAQGRQNASPKDEFANRLVNSRRVIIEEEDIIK
jgi:hypothetical protein